MVSLKGKHSYLRALEGADLDFLYQLENNSEFWEISNTVTPYSKEVLQRYLDNAHRDIYDVQQLRLCICNTADDQVLGFVDFFEFDPKNKRVGLGLVIKEVDDRNKGIGTEVISLCCDYAFNALGVHQIYANILEGNLHSIHVFEKLGFKKAGIKKDWIWFQGKFKNEVLLQKIKKDDKS